MVTRLYTPLIQPYSPVINRSAPAPAESPEQPQSQGNEFNLNQQSRGLSTLEEQGQKQKITINTVLDDFRGTVKALGASEAVQQEVDAYLQVVTIQAQKEKPSVPIIKQNLKVAADSLDGFITDSLGQPTKVVRDWVDALLMQNIDYQQPTGTIEQALPTKRVDEAAAQPEELSSASLALAEVADKSEVSSLSTADKKQVKALIEQAQAHRKDKNWEAAQAGFQEALVLVQDKERPDLEGKLLLSLAKLQDAQRKPDEAMSYYQKAQQKLQACGNTAKESQAHYGIASLSEEQGQFEQAKTHYQAALALDKTLGNQQAQVRTLNDLGSLALRTGDIRGALQSLKQAVNTATEAGPSPYPMADIFSNLGAAQRAAKQYPQAIRSYQSALQHDYQARNATGYLSTLQNMAATYLDMQKPEQAFNVLQRMDRLKQKVGLAS